jgi:hypothetical protein
MEKGNQTDQVDRRLDCLEIGSTGYLIPLLHALERGLLIQAQMVIRAN